MLGGGLFFNGHYLQSPLFRNYISISFKISYSINPPIYTSYITSKCSHLISISTLAHSPHSQIINHLFKFANTYSIPAHSSTFRCGFDCSFSCSHFTRRISPSAISMPVISPSLKQQQPELK